MENKAMSPMMTIDLTPFPRNEASFKEPISWKLYENPFYFSQPQQNKNKSQNQNQLHRLHLPLSARKIASSFWDLTFFRPIMESELDLARAQIMELKSEIARERKARKKVESTNRKLMKEAAEEKKRREAAERVCEDFAGEIAAGKAEIDRKRREIEEERKMMRVAEVLREERVQMKLADARIILEEKISELEISKKPKPENVSVSAPAPAAIQRRVSPEAENPHIKRGIRGFVEFPRVVRAIGSKSKHWGSKLECQKAQLRILLKQRSSVGTTNGLIVR